MIFTQAFLQELYRMSEADLKEIGFNRKCIEYSMSEISDIMQQLYEVNRKNKALENIHFQLVSDNKIESHR